MGKYKNISFLNIGLYDVTGMVRFKNAIWGSSHIVEKDSEDINSMNYINKLVMRGDDLNLQPTIIKMDIEGSELKALEGLTSTIRKNNSKLAICVYHKLEDLWEIPLFIKKINKNYDIYMRHHSYTDTETVCYAHVK